MDFCTWEAMGLVSVVYMLMSDFLRTFAEDAVFLFNLCSWHLCFGIFDIPSVAAGCAGLPHQPMWLFCKCRTDLIMMPQKCKLRPGNVIPPALFFFSPQDSLGFFCSSVWILEFLENILWLMENRKQNYSLQNTVYWLCRGQSGKVFFFFKEKC